jgi:hypothetical protein
MHFRHFGGLWGQKQQKCSGAFGAQDTFELHQPPVRDPPLSPPCNTVRELIGPPPPCCRASVAGQHFAGHVSDAPPVPQESGGAQAHGLLSQCGDVEPCPGPPGGLAAPLGSHQEALLQAFKAYAGRLQYTIHWPTGPPEGPCGSSGGSGWMGLLAECEVCGSFLYFRSLEPLGRHACWLDQMAEESSHGGPHDAGRGILVTCGDVEENPGSRERRTPPSRVPPPRSPAGPSARDPALPSDGVRVPPNQPLGPAVPPPAHHPTPGRFTAPTISAQMSLLLQLCDAGMAPNDINMLGQELLSTPPATTPAACDNRTSAVVDPVVVLPAPEGQPPLPQLQRRPSQDAFVQGGASFPGGVGVLEDFSPSGHPKGTLTFIGVGGQQPMNKRTWNRPPKHPRPGTPTPIP